MNLSRCSFLEYSLFTSKNFIECVNCGCEYNVLQQCPYCDNRLCINCVIHINKTANEINPTCKKCGSSYPLLSFYDVDSEIFHQLKRNMMMEIRGRVIMTFKLIEDKIHTEDFIKNGLIINKVLSPAEKISITTIMEMLITISRLQLIKPLKRHNVPLVENLYNLGDVLMTAQSLNILKDCDERIHEYFGLLFPTIKVGEPEMTSYDRVHKILSTDLKQDFMDFQQGGWRNIKLGNLPIDNTNCIYNIDGINTYINNIINKVQTELNDDNIDIMTILLSVYQTKDITKLYNKVRSEIKSLLKSIYNPDRAKKKGISKPVFEKEATHATLYACVCPSGNCLGALDMNGRCETCEREFCPLCNLYDGINCPTCNRLMLVYHFSCECERGDLRCPSCNHLAILNNGRYHFECECERTEMRCPSCNITSQPVSIECECDTSILHDPRQLESMLNSNTYNFVRKCSVCDAFISRVERCADMMCTSCRTMFNWLTGEPVSNSRENYHKKDPTFQENLIAIEAMREVLGGLQLHDMIFDLDRSIKDILLKCKNMTFRLQSSNETFVTNGFRINIPSKPGTIDEEYSKLFTAVSLSFITMDELLDHISSTIDGTITIDYYNHLNGTFIVNMRTLLLRTQERLMDLRKTCIDNKIEFTTNVLSDARTFLNFIEQHPVLKDHRNIYYDYFNERHNIISRYRKSFNSIQISTMPAIRIDDGYILN